MADVSNITKIEYTLNSPDSIILTGTTKAYVTKQTRKKKPAKQFLMKRVLAKRPIIQFRQLRTLRRDTVHSISVYRRKKYKKKEASQSTDTDSPSATPEAEFAKAPSARVTQQEQDVKQKYSHSTEINFTTSCTRTLFVEEEITSREHSINEY